MTRVSSRFALAIAVPTLAIAIGCSSSTSPSANCLVSASNLVAAGTTVRLNFSLPRSAASDGLSYELDYAPYPLSSGWAMSCQLFDGDRLLGSGDCRGHWQSTTAAFPTDRYPTADFSTITAGTSTAHIDFTVTGGIWAFDTKGIVYWVHTISTPSGPGIALDAQATTSPLQYAPSSCR